MNIAVYQTPYAVPANDAAPRLCRPTEAGLKKLEALPAYWRGRQMVRAAIVAETLQHPGVEVLTERDLALLAHDTKKLAEIEAQGSPS